MSFDGKVPVYIEIEKDSNMKYEFCKEQKKLILDRILPEPYVYPYAYGYIVGTKAMDGDELDILILTNKHIPNDTCLDAYIVGVLIMEDEKGLDEKILCVLDEDTIRDIGDIPAQVLETIHSFFSHYKSKTPGKWSVVRDYRNREHAIALYKASIVADCL